MDFKHQYSGALKGYHSAEYFCIHKLQKKKCLGRTKPNIARKETHLMAKYVTTTFIHV